MFLCITEQDSSTDVTLVGIGLYEQNNLHTLSLKRCKLSSESLCNLQQENRREEMSASLLSLHFVSDRVRLFCSWWYKPISSSSSSVEESCFIPQQSNLHTITLSECKLNNEATNSFIPSLLSPHGKLNNFSLFNCTFSTTDHTYQISLFKLQQTNCRVSLNATGSSFVINHCLSLLSSSSKLLTDMNLNITKQDSSTDELLEEIGLYHHEQNSLTLSLTKCKLSNEALISSLLFSCCKLHKLSLLSLHLLSDRVWRLFCSYKPIPTSVTSVDESCSVMHKNISVNSVE